MAEAELLREQIEAWRTKLDEVVKSKRIIVGELDDARGLLREITEENTALRGQLAKLQLDFKKEYGD